VALLKPHLSKGYDTKVLDLCCGKGAVSVAVARELGVRVEGFDLLLEFVLYARDKAVEHDVAGLCRFENADVNFLVDVARGYDAVIFGAAGNVLGEPREMLGKLKQVVRPGGYIVIDEGYLGDDTTNADINYQNYDYLTKAQWDALFAELGLTLVEEMKNTEDYDFDSDNFHIQKRAAELSEKFPDKKPIFDGYVASQLAECEDLETNIVAVTWLLQA
jgi:ubiquinone/menaquinone biosynthesis C-methylase UbiE